MKKLLPFFLIIVLVSGCKKEEEPSHPLAGEWEASDFTTSIAVDENMDGIKNTDLKKEIDCISMICNFDSKQIFSFESSHMTYDVKVENGQVIMTPKGCKPSIENGTWEYDESINLLYLTFNVAGSSQTNFVPVKIELTQNELIMKDMIYDDADELVLYTVHFVRTGH